MKIGIKSTGLRRAYRRALILTICAVLAAISVLVSFLLRFDLTLPRLEYRHLVWGVWIAVAIKVIVFRLMRKDRSWLQYFSLRELWGVVQANMLGSALFAGVTLYTLPNFPRSVLVIDFIVCFLLTAGARSSVRVYDELLRGEFSTTDGRKGLLIYGAGRAGATVAKEIQSNPSLRRHVVGFLDDESRKRYLQIMEIPVLGTGRDAPSIVSRYRGTSNAIEEIVVAMPSATGAEKREALANCRSAGVPCRIVPGVGELLSGRVLTRQIREVSVLDLLGREPVRLDEAPIRSALQGRVVMITGAGGSIGSELCCQVARFGPAQIVAFDQAETDLFRIERELRETFPKLELIPQIGDISDEARVSEVIRSYAVNSIFHAAAYKHVPMMEAHVLEAVKNNVVGTYHLVEAARRNSVADFLMISSDKAVNPTSIMGLTKRIAELIVGSMPVAQSKSGTRFVSVRFGNVLDSNGSVIPLFREQIAAGGPVTVTHPDVKRYFMIIPEAVQLVLQASTMGNGSDLFELDMGEPIRIVDLAQNMIRLSGHEPDKEIEIRYTGLRPGEKLFEELTTAGEDLMPTYHEKIKIFRGRTISHGEAQQWMTELKDLMRFRDEFGVLQHLRRIVPEYVPLGRWAQGLEDPEPIQKKSAVAAS